MLRDLFYFVSDYEHIVIIFCLLTFFVLGLKAKTNMCKMDNREFILDKNFSNALKGIACVLILMSHYESATHMRLDYYPWGISKVIFSTSANMGLVWFMFISGYGLTKSKIGDIEIGKDFIKRIGKVLIPMLIVYVCSFIVFAFIDRIAFISPDEAIAVPRDYFMFNNTIEFSWIYILTIPFRQWWYVWCIFFYYIFFYLSLYVNKKTTLGVTLPLFALLVVYYFVSYNIAGQNYAHYYRLTWAFFAGHIVGYYKNIKRWVRLVSIGFMILSILLEDKFQIVSFCMAMGILCIVSRLNKFYDFKGSILLWLGSISYFFYLSHRRISWVIMEATCFVDLIIWLLLSLIVSYVIYKFYKKIFPRWNLNKKVQS